MVAPDGDDHLPLVGGPGYSRRLRALADFDGGYVLRGERRKVPPVLGRAPHHQEYGRRQQPQRGEQERLGRAVQPRDPFPKGELAAAAPMTTFSE